MFESDDLLAALRTDLVELTALHAAPGAEQPVIARLRDLFAPLVAHMSIDHMGNLTAHCGGPADLPHIVVSAHADEIGAVVAAIEPEGFLRLRPLGGVQAHLLEGRAVTVGGQPGVIGARSGHLLPRGSAVTAATFDDLYVDLGVDTAGEVAALGVQIGDPVVVLSALRSLAGTRVAGKGIDNRAACVLLLHLLRRVQGQVLPCRLTALVTVQEEVGLRGAQTAYARLQPDLALIVDTAPAGGTPDARSVFYPVRIGAGVLIQPVNGSGERGFVQPRAARDALLRTARRAGVAVQLAVGGGGVTDAAAAHLATGGIPTLQIQIPRRYSHSPVEVLDLRDLAAALQLVEDLVKQPPGAHELVFLPQTDGSPPQER